MTFDFEELPPELQEQIIRWMDHNSYYHMRCVSWSMNHLTESSTVRKNRHTVQYFEQPDGALILLWMIKEEGGWIINRLVEYSAEGIPKYIMPYHRAQIVNLEVKMIDDRKVHRVGIDGRLRGNLHTISRSIESWTIESIIYYDTTGSNKMALRVYTYVHDPDGLLVDCSHPESLTKGIPLLFQAQPKTLHEVITFHRAQPLVSYQELGLQEVNGGRMYDINPIDFPIPTLEGWETCKVCKDRSRDCTYQRYPPELTFNSIGAPVQAQTTADRQMMGDSSRFRVNSFNPVTEITNDDVILAPGARVRYQLSGATITATIINSEDSDTEGTQDGEASYSDDSTDEISDLEDFPDIP